MGNIVPIVEAPLFSIIIPTFCRPNLLKWCLCSLAKQLNIQQCEIFVLNDGIQDDTEKICESFSDKLCIKYVFTGSRNTEYDLKWRVPGFALNIGIKLAASENIIICSSDMFLIEPEFILKYYHTLCKNKMYLVHSLGAGDDTKEYTQLVEQMDGDIFAVEAVYDKIHSNCKLNTKLPFFLGVKKEHLMAIGGYDEDFVGVAYDDNDLIDRLLAYGCEHFLCSGCNLVHLYHKRKQYLNKQKCLLNLRLFKSRASKIKRNEGREWGV